MTRTVPTDDGASAYPRHRAEHRPIKGRRVARPVRPRYGRIGAFTTAAVVTVVSVAAGVGLLPADQGEPADAAMSSSSYADGSAAVVDVDGAKAGEISTEQPTGRREPVEETADAPSRDLPLSTQRRAADPALPADSGTGRRVVFDQSDQRVWLVEDGDVVRRTYLVSGSLLDNLRPGSYAVYSRSRWAVGIDDAGVMEYMVRFTRGVNAAIGFHTIPTKNGKPLQTVAQLGTPQSHGCIRQATKDAVALWEFAPVGTAVVVTA